MRRHCLHPLSLTLSIPRFKLLSIRMENNIDETNGTRDHLRPFFLVGPYYLKYCPKKRDKDRSSDHPIPGGSLNLDCRFTCSSHSTVVTLLFSFFFAFPLFFLTCLFETKREFSKQRRSPAQWSAFLSRSTIVLVDLGLGIVQPAAVTSRHKVLVVEKDTNRHSN